MKIDISLAPLENLDDIKNAISTNHILYKNLKIDDIYNASFINGKYTPHGIYIYHDIENKEILYIGKASSRTFVERVPSHFDIRANGTFNNFIKNVCVLDNERFEITNEMLMESYSKIIMKMAVSIIPIEIQNKEERSKILFAEKKLINIVKSKYNGARRRTMINIVAKFL